MQELRLMGIADLIGNLRALFREATPRIKADAVSHEDLSALEALMKSYQWDDAEGSNKIERPTHAKLADLLNLSPRSATPSMADGLLSVQQCTDLCIQKTRRAHSYCSYSLVRDRSRAELKSRDYVYLGWRLDFSCPDKYHVRQAFLPEDVSDVLLDEWIAIGNEYYTCLPVWLRADNGADLRPRSSLLPEKFLEILNVASPVRTQRYQYHDEPYLLFEYHMTELPASFGEVQLPTAGDFHLSLWVDLTTNLLVKAVVSSAERSELEQAFAAYNEDVLVKQPHIGMEPVPEVQGRYVVIDNRRMPFPFHA